jgi:endoglycosylceramidase
VIAVAVAPLQNCDEFDRDGCLTPSFGAVDEAPAELTAGPRFLRDSDGRAVILRGVNVAGDSKVPPFTPISDASMLDPLPSWGFNTIRLSFTWEAYEPFKCWYDEAYLDYYEQVVEWAAERGLYVVVDFHQDAYSRYSIDGCGSGFPSWATPEDLTLFPPDNSAATCTGWGVKAISSEEHLALWEHFHSDRDGIKSRYVQMTKLVADRMASHPNVIGYDVINEPWGTDEQLTALFNDVGAAIRERHPSSVLFIPPAASNTTGLLPFQPPTPSFDNVVYSPHYYDGLLLLSKIWSGTSPRDQLNALYLHALVWDSPIFLSEFGVPAGTINGLAFRDEMYDFIYDGFVSSAVWNYTPGWTPELLDGWNGEDLSIVDNTGNLRDNFVTRAFPVAIAGQPVSFEADENGMTAVYLPEPSQGATDFYVPSWLSAGRSVRVDGPASCSYTSSLTLSCTASGTDSVVVYVE